MESKSNIKNKGKGESGEYPPSCRSFQTSLFSCNKKGGLMTEIISWTLTIIMIILLIYTIYKTGHCKQVCIDLVQNASGMITW